MPQAPDSLAIMFGIDERALRIAWTIFLFGLLLAIVYFIRDTLIIFAAAIFFAYMLAPVIEVVERLLPKRRNLALTVVYISLVGLLVFLGFELIPAVSSEATNLLMRLPALVNSGTLTRIYLPHWLDPFRAQVIAALNREATSLQSSVVPFLQKTGSQILSGIRYTVPFILIPILAFFFLKDARTIRGVIVGSVDKGHDQKTVRLILDDVHEVLKNYIRALVLLAISSFVGFAIFLTLLRYPYELLLAGICAILEFLPVVGPAAALVILLAVCLITGSGGLLWILIFWGCFRIFQDYILNPYLMSAGTELHPLLVLFGVLAGDSIAGIPGMFFSVPVLAILKVIYNHLRTAYARRELSSMT